MQPNVVLISTDQMRGDCIGALGHPVVETPNLDALCRNGISFTHAYSATPTCIPARAALLTGLSQKSHGRVGYKDGVPWNYRTTLPQVFTDAGYQTQCVGKMHAFPVRSQMGFQNVTLHDGYFHFSRLEYTPYAESWERTDDYIHWLREHRPGADLIDTGLECNSWVARPWIYDEMLHPTNWVVSQSIDFLRRRDPRKPFFLHMSFVRPHPPFDPPRVYFDQYSHAPLPDSPIGDWADAEDRERNGLRPSGGSGVINENALKRAKAAYHALITHIDHQIGRFTQKLFESGTFLNTIILFTSDHGELLGDHNLFGKRLPYEGSTRVPFILSCPGGNGAVCESPVELRDVMPTLLDCAGIDIPACVEGKSVLHLLNGETTDWREYIHGEHTLSGNNSAQFIVSEKEKYIWFSKDGREQYFNLENDRQETRDLSKDARYRDRVAELRRCLIQELTGREEGFTDGERLIPGRKTVTCLKFIKG